MEYKSLFKQYCLCLMGLLILSCSSDDDDSKSNNNSGFFTSIYNDSPLDCTLSFDLDSLVYYKDTKKEVQGILTIDDGNKLIVPVELRARGVFRKKLCPVPPIRLQLKKAAIAENNWGPYRNYKLVTHCFDTVTTDELLLREFLIYKMYEELSDMSFRAQLLRMHYLVRNDTIKHFAILVENESEMSARLGLQEMDIEKTKLKRVHFEHYKRFALFQYMVGNTDWNLGKGHNTKFVLEEGSDTPIIIPYDFDCCGLVNAPYAIPYSTIPIKDVRERYFMYRGKKTDDFTHVINMFLEKKEALFSMVNNFSYLSENARVDVLNYLGEFYTIIEQPNWKDQLFGPE